MTFRPIIYVFPLPGKVRTIAAIVPHIRFVPGTPCRQTEERREAGVGRVGHGICHADRREAPKLASAESRGV